MPLLHEGSAIAAAGQTTLCEWAHAWFWKWADDPIAVFTALLVLVTFGLAIYTAKLWGATGALAKGADETARRQLRAYVAVDTEQVRNAHGTPKLNIIGLAIKNCGQTPAHKLSHWTQSGVVEFPLQGLLPPPNIPDSTRVKTILHPGMHRMILLPFSLTDESKAQILSGKFAFYVWGEVTYLDAFNEPRKTRYCFFLNDDAIAHNRMAHYESGNDAT